MTGSALAISDTERRIAERIDPATMGGLSVSAQAGGLVFANADQVTNFAKMMAVANSGIRKHLRGNPGACLAICTQAVEWGLSPFQVANKSYFVNDQLAFESQLIQAVILKRAPIKGRIKFEFTGQGDRRVCRAWARLADDPDEIADYISPEFGKITPKNSPLWKTDPDQQHAYYAGRALCRRHFPDVLLGVYSDDELGPPAAEPHGDFRRVPNPLQDTIEHKPAPIDPDPAPDLPEIQANGDEPAAPEIDRTSPDFMLGYEGGIQGMPRKGLTAEIKADPARLANYEAGRDAGAAQAGKDDE